MTAPKPESLVSVGIPCYNRPDGLRRTLECITRQTYENLEIVISDNFSENSGVEAIGREYAEKDSRIRYFRQEKNIGAYKNFEFVLNQSKGTYFMWASDDDLWDLDYISSCMEILLKKPYVGFAFSNILNIDSSEREIRNYESFSRFTGLKRGRIILKYLLEPEINGKANPIYSVIKTGFCREVYRAIKMNDKYWGCDMSFVLGLLARAPLVVNEKIMIKKMMPDVDSELLNSELKIVIKNPYLYTVPLLKFPRYMYNNYLATKGTKYCYMIILCIPVKFLVSLYGLFGKGIILLRRKLFRYLF